MFSFFSPATLFSEGSALIFLLQKKLSNESIDGNIFLEKSVMTRISTAVRSETR
jgi:hypothetical protein